MSLKNIVIFLLIANLGYFGYSQGWLEPLMGSDAAQREPGRMNRQVNAEAISVSLTPKKIEAPIAVMETPIAPAPLVPEQVPACASEREPWVIYMGPYANKTLANKKKAELSRLGVDSNSISKPTLKIGLSLGQFESEIAARAAFNQFRTQGVKTATVVLWTNADCPAN